MDISFVNTAFKWLVISSQSLRKLPQDAINPAHRSLLRLNSPSHGIFSANRLSTQKRDQGSSLLNKREPLGRYEKDVRSSSLMSSRLCHRFAIFSLVLTMAFTCGTSLWALELQYNSLPKRILMAPPCRLISHGLTEIYLEPTVPSSARLVTHLCCRIRVVSAARKWCYRLAHLICLSLSYCKLQHMPSAWLTPSFGACWRAYAGYIGKITANAWATD